MIPSIAALVQEAREVRRRDAIGCAAAADYIADFERLDRLARQVREAGCPEAAAIIQERAEIAYRAHFAELAT